MGELGIELAAKCLVLGLKGARPCIRFAGGFGRCQDGIAFSEASVAARIRAGTSTDPATLEIGVVIRPE